MLHKKQQQEENKHPFTDEQTDKRIHEHLLNEEDHISEDDIRNVKTNMGEDVDMITEEPEIENDDQPVNEEEVIRDNNDPGIDTSWNILDS